MEVCWEEASRSVSIQRYDSEAFRFNVQIQERIKSFISERSIPSCPIMLNRYSLLIGMIQFESLCIAERFLRNLANSWNSIGIIPKNSFEFLSSLSIEPFSGAILSASPLRFPSPDLVCNDASYGISCYRTMKASVCIQFVIWRNLQLWNGQPRNVRLVHACSPRFWVIESLWSLSDQLSDDFVEGSHPLMANQRI